MGVDTLADTIRKAARGEAVLHPQVAARVIRELQGLRAEARSLAAELSERELEVLTLIANGARGPHPPGWMSGGHVMRIVVRIELFPSLFPLD